MSTTGNPTPAGPCWRCGNPVHHGLSHQCPTSIGPTQKIITVPTAIERLQTENQFLRGDLARAVDILRMCGGR